MSVPVFFRYRDVCVCVCVLLNHLVYRNRRPPQKEINKPSPFEALQKTKRNPGLTLPGRPRIKSRKRKAPASYSGLRGFFEAKKNMGKNLGPRQVESGLTSSDCHVPFFEKKRGGVKLLRDKEGCTPNVRVLPWYENCVQPWDSWG